MLAYINILSCAHRHSQSKDYIKQALSIMETASITTEHGSNPGHYGLMAGLLEDYAKLELDTGLADNAVRLLRTSLQHREKQDELGGGTNRLEALKSLTMALRLASQPPELRPETSIAALDRSVDVDEAREMLQESEQCAQQALTILSQDDGGLQTEEAARMYFELGETLKMMGRYKDAGEAYKNCASIMSSHPFSELQW
jgi:tetratricopeptide (TPR) repeat protein